MNPDKTLTITTPSERELAMNRVFDAPRVMVFDALTQPDLVRQWYGPRGWSMIVCEIDLRVDGAWRFVSRQPNGKEVGQRGVYREVVRPERLVNTESWEDWNPGELLVTALLVEDKGKTTLTTTMRFPSQEVRDMLMKAGMTSGAAESYEALDKLLAAVKQH